MTTQEQKVMELALEALQDYVDEYGPWSDDSGAQYVLRVGKEALAQTQEPVKMVAYSCTCGRTMKFESVHGVVAPQRTFVGLTDEEKKNIFLKWYGKHWAYTEQVQSVMNSVEAKLKELNT